VVAPAERPNSPDADALAGGGEMGALMRSIDWVATPLGPVHAWSPTLKTMVSFLLANRFPILLWWGPDYIQLYNDAYRPILGAKHPRSMGQPVRDCWWEIYDVIGPLIDTPFHGGPATWMDDILLEVKRHGFAEETHFTIAYSPVPDPTADRGIGGVIATVTETTEQVIGERRVLALRDLGTQSVVEAKTAEQACAAAADVLSQHSRDMPFALIYLLDRDENRMRLAGVMGTTAGGVISPKTIDLGDAASDPVGWPMREALETEALHIVEHLGARFPDVPPGPWSDPPHTGVAVPIASNIAHRPAGVLVAGVSPRHGFDEQYATFFELVARQISSAVASARAYEDEKRRAEALAELDRAKTAFFSNVSHEFRTPLTLLLGPAQEVLADPKIPPADRRRVEVIHRNALRLQRLVNTLLDFSRIEAGRVDAVYESTDLAASTRELASNFQSAVDAAGLALVVDAPPIGQPVYVDREMWEKIVLNLISNAFKHTFKGEIGVSLHADETHVQLMVRDTGVGIPAGQVSNIFKRFNRVAQTRSRTHEGSGIGLALVQELVRLHDGTISVASEEGKGTAFTVRIPLGTSHLPQEKLGAERQPPSPSVTATPFVEEALQWLPEPEPRAEPGGQPASNDVHVDGAGRILIADDNADMRDYVTRLLRGRGWIVEAVADGYAARDAARLNAPDLVLADVMMPGLDGFALLRELRADPSTADMPVILLSARAGEEARVEGLAAGADDYLVKPFSTLELAARVKATLHAGQVRRDIKQRTAQFETLFNNAPIGVYLVDSDFRLAALNPTARERFGGKTDLVGRDFDDLMHVLRPKSRADDVVRRFRHTLETGESYAAPEDKLQASESGQTEFYQWRISRIPLTDGRYGVVCYFLDITAQVHARRDAEAARAAAESANSAKSEFLAAMSHELRTPLNAIAGYVQLLTMGVHGPLSDEQRQVLGRVEMSERHLLSLITDVLNFAKIEARRVEYDIKSVPLATAVANVGAMMAPQLMAKGLVFENRIRDASAVRGDPDKVQQILLNLLSNATKFTPTGGRIVVDAPTRQQDEKPDATLFLRVSDTGPGIPSDKQEAIFEPFVQVDRGLSRPTEGTGLGLAISRDLARGMGGDLRVRSRVGQGSSFTLSMPAA
jgi:PAS domain S-box-containing protein